MTVTTDVRSLTRLLTAPEADIADDLSALSTGDQIDIYGLRASVQEAQTRTDQHAHLGVLVNDRPDSRPAYFGRVHDVTVFAAGEHDVVDEAVFATTTRDTTTWRVVTGGKLSRHCAASQVEALLLWVELTHNGGRADQGARYAARVLGVPDPS